MATRGRKPQTKEQKRAKGETRPSRTPPENVLDFPAVSTAPKPPTWLRFKASKDLWNQLVDRLMGQRVLTEVDLHALAHLCQMHGEQIDQIKRKLQPTSAERSQLRMYFSEFGLTPSSRTRVGVPPGGAGSDNPFARHGRKPDN